MTKKTKKIYLCNNCGNEFAAWAGQCAACGEWNTIVEMSVAPEVRGNFAGTAGSIQPKPLQSIKISKGDRVKTGIGEFDRVLGGGIMPGSLILIGGEPGIGKSTILLQVCEKIGKAFYLSAEESLEQIKERADRLDVKAPEMMLVSSGDLESIDQEIAKTQPKLVVIDSIQTVYLNSADGTAGSIVQVKECGIFLQRLAKTSGIPVVIVGHVTKEGSLAGPRTLEHLVDVVLYFEGDRYQDLRILRGVKNRFGPTDEVGIFSLQEKGLQEVKNTAGIFLKEDQKLPGSVVAVTIEGTRPMLIEVQALVVPTSFGYPRRTASGFDLNRLNLLSAVISKSTPINLGNYDIYLNVVGGMKISEPAIDLAVVAAIVSSFKNRTCSENYCFFGEVGLSGEVRQVRRQKERTKEAENLGFVVPQNIKYLSQLVKLF